MLSLTNDPKSEKTSSFLTYEVVNREPFWIQLFESSLYELTTPDENAVGILFEELEFRRIAENFKKIFAPQNTKASLKMLKNLKRRW